VRSNVEAEPKSTDGATTREALLEVRDLRTYFERPGGDIKAVDGLSYRLQRGRALGIVGESGSGKSVGVRSLLGLQPRGARIVSGEAWFGGRDLLAMSAAQLRQVRGKDISMVFQNAMDALNPTLTLVQQISEPLLWHGICGKSEARTRAIAALDSVGIPEPERRVDMYSFQLSGGMRQRAMIAAAIVTNPSLIIADEPTTAVDVTVQRQILSLLRALKDAGSAVIMITHDLGVARYFCDDIVVMYGGKMMERASIKEFMAAPKHPYSQALLGSTLVIGDRRDRLTPIPGAPPDLSRLPAGCPFHPRCGQMQDADACREPQQLISLGAGSEAACWRVGDER